MKIFQRKLVFCLLFLFVVLSSTNSIAQNESKTTTNILFIGNSFTLNNNMPSIFENIATSNHQDVNVLMSAKGGHSFQMHADRKELYTDINKQKWDYVVLQGYSRELMFGKDHTDSVVVPPLNKIIDSLKKNNPCVNILLYMTWGYQNGYKEADTLFTYDQMTDSIDEGYRYLSDLYNLSVVPIGMIWREIQQQFPNYSLYHPDGSHPSKLASFAIATSFFFSIYREIPNTDISIKDLQPEQINHVTPIVCRYIQQNKDKYRQNMNFVEINSDHKQQLELLASINYAHANSFEVNFGDGTQRIDTALVQIKHRYSTPNTYLLKLLINDVCGQRTVVRNIVFKEVEQTNRKKKHQKNSPNKNKPGR